MKIEEPNLIEYCLDQIDSYSLPETVTSRIEEGDEICIEQDSTLSFRDNFPFYKIDDSKTYENLPVFNQEGNPSPEDLLENIKRYFQLGKFAGEDLDMDEILEERKGIFREENNGNIFSFTEMFNRRMGYCLESSILFQLASQPIRKTCMVHTSNYENPHVFNIISPEGEGGLYVMDIRNTDERDKNERVKEFDLEFGSFITKNRNKEGRPYKINKYSDMRRLLKRRVSERFDKDF